MNRKRALIVIAWSLLVLGYISVTASPMGVAAWIVIEPSIVKAQVIYTFAHIGFFAAGFVLWRMTRNKKQDGMEFEDHSNITAVIIGIVLYAVYFGRFVDCDDVFRFCPDKTSSTSATCYDKQGAYACDE